MQATTLTLDLLTQWYLLGVVTLIPIVNPFSTVPLLLSRTRGMSVVEARYRQATRAAIYAALKTRRPRSLIRLLWSREAEVFRVCPKRTNEVSERRDAYMAG